MDFEVLREIENNVRKHWDYINLKKIINEENKKRNKKFWLLDGPPTPNDEPHVGHGRNIVTKDFFLKLYFSKGYKIIFKPGFDMHGLPIEVKVEKVLNIKNKKEILEYGVDKFIEKCREFAKGNMDKWLESYKKLGHFYQFEEPYMTPSKEYMETQWYIFKKIYENGLIYREKRPVWYCPRCQTTLSGYEVVDEYTELEDPSIFVKFPLRDEENTYLLVWTTTPWTLNGNVAIAVHPEEYYVKVKVNNEYLILAEKRLKVLDEIGIKYEVVDKFLGKELEGKKYKRVIDNEIQREMDEKAHIVVLSIPILKGYVGSKILTKKDVEESKAREEHFVNMEEGTGLVHIATGHGKEDFLVGKKYNLPIFSIVDDEGKITTEPFKGIFFRDANEKVIEYLEEKGYLFYATKIKHRYPLCWRCKTPLVIKLQEDFFINIQKIKEDLKNIVENKIKYNPEFARERQINWIENEEDWDISRQRFWGTPIPVWKCENCGEELVIGSIEELEKYSKIKINDLHKNVVDKIEIKCPKCGGNMKRVKDIFDVWFDSGVATFASLHWPFENKELMKKIWRVDIIMEGQDQIRGWFVTLLKSSYASINDYPYDRVLMFGWTVDANGQKMSKRLGNVIWLNDAIDKTSADALRYYILSKVSPWETMYFDLNEIKKDVLKVLNVFMNVTKYIIERSREFNKVKIKKLKIEDKWLITKFNELLDKLENLEKEGKINEYVKALEKFGVVDVSRNYIKMVRDRIQYQKDPTPLYILTKIWKKFLVLLLPITPHLAEHLYQKFDNTKPTIFLEKYPEKEEIHDEKARELVDLILKIQDKVAFLRQKYNIKARYPLKSIYYDENIEKLIDKNYKKEFDDLLKRFLNIKNIEKTEGEVVELDEGKVYVSLEYDKELAFINELARLIQERRKKLGFKIYEKLILKIYTTDKEIIEKYKKELEKRVNCKIKFVNEKQQFVEELFDKKIYYSFEREKEGIIDKIKKIFKLQ